MELTGITLVLVSLTFFGSSAAETCRNGTRPRIRKNEREGCDYYCWNTTNPFMGQIFRLGTMNHFFTILVCGGKLK
uniref:Putative tick salivary peptide group 1 n=1 Tax=Ixodes ricinus TaxID=34613 RepID=V5HPH5_IXORI